MSWKLAKSTLDSNLPLNNLKEKVSNLMLISLSDAKARIKAPLDLDPPTPRQLAITPGPYGKLTVRLHEAVGLSVPDGKQETWVMVTSSSHTPSGTTNTSIRRRQSLLPYAVLDYNRSQVSVDSLLGTVEDPRWGLNHGAATEFDVSWPAKLSIHLFLRIPEALQTNRSQGFRIGTVRLNPFDPTTTSGSKWRDVQDGTGKLRISLEYIEHVNQASFELNFSQFARLDRAGGVLQVRKKDTHRLYAWKAIPGAEFDSVPESKPALQHISHPFISPLVYAGRSLKGKLELCTPFISGGHLFSHLQRARRFDVNWARFYTAEMVCAVEYLHSAAKIVSWVKPANVLLDSLGHICLCGSGVFRNQISSDNAILHRSAEYPAPELLSDDPEDHRSVPGAADWWTLGVFLHEMLTGLPPFYDRDTEKIRHNILNKDVESPEFLSLSPSAIDIITKFLELRPSKRLGASGPSEVKSHAFFQGIDWDEIIHRRYVPVMKPGYFVNAFHQYGVSDPQEPCEESLNQWPLFTYMRPPEVAGSQAATTNIPPTRTKETSLSPPKQGPPALVTSSLGKAVSAGDMSLVNYLLAQGVSCNFGAKDIPLPYSASTGDDGCTFGDGPKDYEFTPPLVMAVKRGDIDMARVLLAHGADANARYHCVQWDLEDILTNPSIGFECGRVVYLAMELEDIAMITLLLDHGADVDLELPASGLDGSGSGCSYDARHECEFVSRPTYLRVIAGLRELVAARKI